MDDAKGTLAGYKLERTVEEVIIKYFLGDGKWEKDSDGWLWISDANYGFDPMELVKDILYEIRR